MIKEHYAGVERPPRSHCVYAVRYRKPAKAAKLTLYLTEAGARRRVEKLRAGGIRAQLHVADVSDWQAIE